MRAVPVMYALVCVASIACGDDSDEPGEDAGEQDGATTSEPVDLFDEEDGPAPDVGFLPEPTGTCPDLDGCERDGEARVCKFEPEGVPARRVRIYLDEGAADGPRPLIFFFHGLGGMASNVYTALGGLGSAVVDAMTEAGAIVVSMEMEEGRATTLLNLPWISAARGGAGEGDNRDDDFLVMDDVLGCLERSPGVNDRRIHVTGISAGGLQTGQVLVRRSGYIASAVPFSGGIAGAPEYQDEDNLIPVAVFWGGPNDQIATINFEQEAYNMRERLDMHGNFSIMCDHGMGHMVPAEVAEAAWVFMQDHPYGVESPYAREIPDTMPEYCSLEPPPRD